MSPQERFATALARLATTPSVIRTRREDEVRAGHTPDNLDRLLARHAYRLERMNAELEKELS